MEDSHRHPSVGKSFEIDQRAMKIFQRWLPDNWLVRGQVPDFFIDFLIETVEDGEPTGLHFGAQLKGHGAGPDATLTHSFKTKHLKYYLDRSQHPVFLFLIDTHSEEGYWLFAQQYLKECLHRTVLEKQTTLTVHFSPNDNLHNITKFKSILASAQKYVRDLHPGSVPAAVLRRRQELEAKDSRFSVSVSIRDGKEQITIHPKVPLSITARIPAEREIEWREFLERGSSFNLNSSGVKLVGSPLLEEFFQMGDANAAIHHTGVDAAIEFIGSAEGLPQTTQLPGLLRSGSKFITFTAGKTDSPVTITAEIPLEDQYRKDSKLSQIGVLIDVWAGCNVLQLSAFDQVDTIVTILTSSAPAHARIIVDGNIVYTSKFQGLDTNSAAEMKKIFDWLRKLRLIARRFNINPKLPPFAEINAEQWRTVSFLHQLLLKKEITIPLPHFELEFDADAAAPISKEFSEGSGVLRLYTKEEFEILSQETVNLQLCYQFKGIGEVKFSATPEGKTACICKMMKEGVKVISVI